MTLTDFESSVEQLFENQECDTGADWGEMQNFTSKLFNSMLKIVARRGWQLRHYCYYVEECTYYGRCGDSNQYKYAALITSLTPDEFMDELRQYTNGLPAGEEYCPYKFLSYMHGKDLGVYRHSNGYERIDEDWQGVTFEDIADLKESEIYSEAKYSEIINTREEAKRVAAREEAERKAAEAEKVRKRQEQIDREQYERLKQKFG